MLALCLKTTNEYLERRLGWRSRYSDWLRDKRLGDRMPVEARFSTTVQTGCGAHPVPYITSTGSLSLGKIGRGVALTIHPPIWHQGKRKSRAILPLPLCAFTAYSSVNFNVYLERKGRAHESHTTSASSLGNNCLYLVDSKPDGTASRSRCDGEEKHPLAFSVGDKSTNTDSVVKGQVATFSCRAVTRGWLCGRSNIFPVLLKDINRPIHIIYSYHKARDVLYCNSMPVHLSSFTLTEISDPTSIGMNVMPPDNTTHNQFLVAH